MIPLAVQTYTIRREWQADPHKALQNLKELGVKNLELARVDFDEKTANLVVESGLKVVSIQAKFNDLRDRFDQMAAFLRRMDCKIAVVSVLNLSSILFGKACVVRFAKALDRLALHYQQVGITLAFHHHDFEWKRISGKTKLEWLLETSREIQFVSDTYWCKKRGYDPRDIASLIGERLIGWHLRDYDAVMNHHPDCACGSGAIDFETLLRHAPASVVYGAIEQNSDQPFVDLKTSLRHLNAIQTKETL